VVILRCPRLRRQRFHMFIISLALADILVGLIMPLMTLALKEQMWPFGSTLCQVFTSVQKISLAASFFNFLGISVDRLFAVKKPFAYRKWQQKHSIIRRPLLLCWLLALLPAIPMWIDPTRSYTDVEDNRNCVCKFPYRYNVWIWWNSVVAFILPTILILVGGFLTALHFARASSVHNDNNSVWKRRFLRERKISLMMGTITAAFLLCVTPYYTLFMSPVDLQVKETYLPVLVMVMYLNSLVNPLLYVSLNSEVRAGVFRMLLCKPEPKGQRSRMDTDFDEKIHLRTVAKAALLVIKQNRKKV